EGVGGHAVGGGFAEGDAVGLGAGEEEERVGAAEEELVVLGAGGGAVVDEAVHADVVAVGGIELGVAADDVEGGGQAAGAEGADEGEGVGAALAYPFFPYKEQAEVIGAAAGDPG